MSKAVQMGDKVELTALQLIYLLDEVILDVLDRVEAGEDVDTMEVATDFAVCYVAKHRKENEQ